MLQNARGGQGQANNVQQQQPPQLHRQQIILPLHQYQRPTTYRPQIQRRESTKDDTKIQIIPALAYQSDDIIIGNRRSTTSLQEDGRLANYVPVIPGSIFQLRTREEQPVQAHARFQQLFYQGPKQRLESSYQVQY